MVLGGALALCSRAAAADDFSLRKGLFNTDAGYGEPLAPNDIKLRTNTVRYEVMRQASLTNAQVYGSIGAFDRYVRPRIALLKKDNARASSGYFAAYEVNQAYGVSEAIGLCGGNREGYCDGRPRRYSLDLYSISMSGVWGDKDSGFFLSGSYSVAYVPPPERKGDAITRPVMLSMLGPIYFPYRLLGKKAFNWLLPGAADTILGFYTNKGPVQGYAGYIASQGLFGDLSAPSIKAFASAAVANQFEQLALLRGGLRDLVLPLADEAEKKVGRTALFARRIQVVAPRAPDPAQSTDKAPGTSQVGVSTIHLEQTDVGSNIDLRAAYGFTPRPFVHEARVAVHTDRFRSHASLATSDDDLGYKGHWGASAMAGVASMPALPYYGVDGGYRFSFNLEAGYFSNDLRLFFYSRMNDPEFLASFPFAYNAPNFGVAIVGRERR